jgi:hypothetical protein
MCVRCTANKGRLGDLADWYYVAEIETLAAKSITSQDHRPFPPPAGGRSVEAMARERLLGCSGSVSSRDMD